MNRADLQALTDLRVQEATVLLNGGCFAGAYYLIGYAVQCALKACIAKQFREFDFPDKDLVIRSYTHDPQKLLNLTGHKSEHDQAQQADPDFAANWNLVSAWSEEARYMPVIAEPNARALFAAATDLQHGVLPWIKRLW